MSIYNNMYMCAIGHSNLSALITNHYGTGMRAIDPEDVRRGRKRREIQHSLVAIERTPVCYGSIHVVYTYVKRLGACKEDAVPASSNGIE